MAELLKDKLNEDSLREFALCFKSVYSPFDINRFISSTMDESWEGLELKTRGRQVCINLGKCLPSSYETAIGIIDKVAERYQGFLCPVFPDFVEVFGLDEENWDISISALERYTQYASSEMAVRPFIIKYGQKMMEQMYAWSKHSNEHAEAFKRGLPAAVALGSRSGRF